MAHGMIVPFTGPSEGVRFIALALVFVGLFTIGLGLYVMAYKDFVLFGPHGALMAFAFLSGGGLIYAAARLFATPVVKPQI